MHRQIIVGSDMTWSEEQHVIALPWKEKLSLWLFASLQLLSWALIAGSDGTGEG